jgi:hypothetical protein
MKTLIANSDLTGIYTVFLDRCDVFTWEVFAIPSLAEAKAFAKRKGGWAEAHLRDGQKINVDSLETV